jgi:hypothetical protein
MSLTLVPPAPLAPVTPRDRLRPRLLRCIQAFHPDLPLAWDDAACLRGALLGQARELVRLCEVVEDEFRITITPTDIVQLALEGATMGLLLDLVEARGHA